jgi:alcohol dehydrogenase
MVTVHERLCPEQLRIGERRDAAVAAFYMPVKIFAEEDAVQRHAPALSAFGRNALIVTGRHSSRVNGALDDVLCALRECGISYAVFDRVEENPSVSTVMEARDYGLEQGADFVIGIGGGSPLDAAKAVALMMRHPECDRSYLYLNPEQGNSGHENGSEHLPVVAVPTTGGTGSEATGVSVLTDPVRQVKKSIPHRIFPALALVDGKYLRSAPDNVLACTAFDALTHLIESWLNSKADSFSRMLADSGLRQWALSLPVFRGKTPDDSDYTNMMCASTMAGMAIAQTGTSIPHGLSYPLTVRLGIPHGKAVSCFMAGYLMASPSDLRLHLLKEAGFSDLEDFQNVLHDACGEVKADPVLLKAVLEEAEEGIASNSAKMKAAPFPVDRDILHRIVWYEF